MIKNDNLYHTPISSTFIHIDSVERVGPIYKISYKMFTKASRMLLETNVAYISSESAKRLEIYDFSGVGISYPDRLRLTDL